MAVLVVGGFLPYAEAVPVGPPNIVFVLADDMRPDEMTMTANMKPNGGFDWVRDHGVRFNKYISTDNLCCPGRTTVLTGKTSYNHGVQTNNNRNTDLKTDSLPIYLTARTIAPGSPVNTTSTAPRFDHMAGRTGSRLYGTEYSYSMTRRNGTRYQPGTYMTDELAKVASLQMRDCNAAGKPAAVAMWPVAPHDGFDPEPDYSNVPISLTPQDPSFNEPDMSDKPLWLQMWFPTYTPESTWALRRANRVRTLLSVDDALKRLINELSASGKLSNTLFVLTSDNGFLLGEHRVRREAAGVRSCSARTLDRGSGIPGWNDQQCVCDKSRSCPDAREGFRGVVPWTKLDGRALQDVLLEPDLGHDRFLPIHVPIEELMSGKQPTGDGVRTWRYKYVKYADGSQEMYDLVRRSV